MYRRIYAIETMGKDTHCRQIVLDSSAVGTHINTIGQAADDEHIGVLAGKIAHQAVAKVAPIIGALASAYDTDHAVWV